MNYLIARKGNLGFLIEQLKDKLSNDVVIGHRKSIRFISEKDKLIRFGCVAKNLQGRDIAILNPARYITQNYDKGSSRRVLRVAGINVPSERIMPPCIGRPANHSKGKNFHVCNTDDDMAKAKRAGCTYFQDIIVKQAEYRVHVAHGHVLIVQKKQNIDANVKVSKSLIWNYNNGFRFVVIPWNEIPKGLNPLAINSVKALGLDFGAVDIMYGKSFTDTMQTKDEFFVAEVNTAPRLDGYTAEKYAQYFDWWITQVDELGKNPEHKEYKEGNKTMFRENLN